MQRWPSLVCIYARSARQGSTVPLHTGPGAVVVVVPSCHGAIGACHSAGPIPDMEALLWCVAFVRFLPLRRSLVSVSLLASWH